MYLAGCKVPCCFQCEEEIAKHYLYSIGALVLCNTASSGITVSDNLSAFNNLVISLRHKSLLKTKSAFLCLLLSIIIKIKFIDVLIISGFLSTIRNS
jgi:hypothetical protein